MAARSACPVPHGREEGLFCLGLREPEDYRSLPAPLLSDFRCCSCQDSLFGDAALCFPAFQVFEASCIAYHFPRAYRKAFSVLPVFVELEDFLFSAAFPVPCP